MQELLEAEAANVKPIEDEIDEERRKVDAKTPITEQVIPVCLRTLSFSWECCSGCSCIEWQTC